MVVFVPVERAGNRIRFCCAPCRRTEIERMYGGRTVSSGPLAGNLAGNPPANSWSSSPQVSPSLEPLGGPPAVPGPTTLLTTFGVLSIAFGGINLLSNALTFAQYALMHAWEPMRSIPSTELTDSTMQLGLGQAVVMSVMDISLLAIGVMILKRSDRARRLAIAWSFVALVVLLGRALAFEALVMPALEHFMASTRATGVIGDFALLTRLSTYVSLGFMAVFPVAMMIGMSTSAAKSATDVTNLRPHFP